MRKMLAVGKVKVIKSNIALIEKGTTLQDLLVVFERPEEDWKQFCELNNLKVKSYNQVGFVTSRHWRIPFPWLYDMVVS